MANKALRDAFGEALVEIGEIFPDVVVVSCDLKSATKTKDFFTRFPERSFEVGIAEANGIGVSAGLALSGLRPFISSFGSFLTGKGLEIAMSVAYNNAPVVLVGTHGGLIGPDGTTQAGIRDVSVMRSMPGIILLQPCSPIEARAMVHYLAGSRQAAYLRVARNEVPEVYDSSYRFVPGKGHVLREGTSLALISSGPMVHNCLKVAEDLSARASIRVINLPSLKPIDRELILQTATSCSAIVTVEDHTIEGGLGSMVCEVVCSEGLPTPVVRHGIMDVFTESGSPAELEKKYKLDAAGIAEVVGEVIEHNGINVTLGSKYKAINLSLNK